MNPAFVRLEPFVARGYGDHQQKVRSIAASYPFVYSRAGKYVHRVRAAAILNVSTNKPHAVYRLWCGMHLQASRSRLSADTADRPICATCEGRAIGAGQLGHRTINGRAVMYSPLEKQP